MAFQEIADHTKKIVEIGADKGHAWREKLQEIALEIAIIVFAVSLSIWFHSWSEHRHEQAQVKTFLLGLKKDLQSDIQTIDEVVAVYRRFDGSYKTLNALPAKLPADAEPVAAALIDSLGNVSYFPQASRYEGFKQSGKLINIQNDALVEDILNLYQLRIPQAETSMRGWNAQHQKYRKYLEDQLDGISDLLSVSDQLTSGKDIREDIAPLYKTISSERSKRFYRSMPAHAQLYERFEKIKQLELSIIKSIDAAYSK